MTIRFVVVEPARPENIGAAARALKTMGFDNSLWLVNPQCEYLTGRALWTAHGSADVLEHARACHTLEEAITETDLVIGTTARRRGDRREYLAPKSLVDTLTDRVHPEGTVAIVFGREESGLSNEELSLCQMASSVPMRRSYPSLNLGQSVMVYAYELSRLAFEPAPATTADAPEQSIRNLVRKTDRVLRWLEFDTGRALYGRIMERVGLMSLQDARLLHSVLNRIVKRFGL